MNKFNKMVLVFGISLVSSSLHAAVINLQDWVFNVDGALTYQQNGDAMPVTGNLVDGLGSLSLEITGTGAHSVIAFFDYEIDQLDNTFFNESGNSAGITANGQSWEIDEPGYLFGDILDNVDAGQLDNSNGVPAGFEDDVAFALGWTFDLFPGDIATINFVISNILPTSGFFLSQYDPDSDFSLYFYSTLSIQAGSVPAPSGVDEPFSYGLLLLGLLGIWVRRSQNR